MKKATIIQKHDKRIEFGQWLKDKRRRAGHYTLHDFAGVAGLTNVHLSRIETGVSGISAESLDRLVIALNLDPVEAFDRAGLLPPSLKQVLEQMRA